MQAQTRDNLLTAMRGEAFAFATYMLFARQARARGEEDLAALFEATARVEAFEHFAEEADLAGFGGDDAANLRQAIAGEAYEVETMYRQFAEQAEAAGDHAAAARFREILADERGHHAAFTAALARLTAPVGV